MGQRPGAKRHMRVSFRASKLCTVTGEGATQKEAFEDLAANMEPFTINCCGVCKNDNIIPVVRKVGKFTYYEMRCKDYKCKARLSYGQSTENGALYPRKKYHENHPSVKSGKAEVGTWIPNEGWEQYVPEEHAEDGEQAVPVKKGKK